MFSILGPKGGGIKGRGKGWDKREWGNGCRMRHKSLMVVIQCPVYIVGYSHIYGPGVFRHVGY